MLKRRIFIAPADADFSDLDFSLVTPMPSTLTVDDTVIIDSLGGTPPEGWQCIYEGDIKGNATIPLDMDALYPYLAPVTLYDEEGNEIGTEPAPRKVPHNWAGWPEVKEKL